MLLRPAPTCNRTRLKTINDSFVPDQEKSEIVLDVSDLGKERGSGQKEMSGTGIGHVKSAFVLDEIEGIVCLELTLKVLLRPSPERRSGYLVLAARRENSDMFQMDKGLCFSANELAILKRTTDINGEFEQKHSVLKPSETCAGDDFCRTQPPNPPHVQNLPSESVPPKRDIFNTQDCTKDELFPHPTSDRCDGALRRSSVPAAASQRPPGCAALLRRGAFLRLLLMAGLGAFAAFSTLFLLPPLALERGASDLTASLTVTVSGATELVTRFLLSPLCSVFRPLALIMKHGKVD